MRNSFAASLNKAVRGALAEQQPPARQVRVSVVSLRLAELLPAKILNSPGSMPQFMFRPQKLNASGVRSNATVRHSPLRRVYVKGERVAAGPSRGDLARWRYQEIDLAPHLRQGANVVAALFGGFAVSRRPA